jgi:putative heme-binding domain-containing protein
MRRFGDPELDLLVAAVWGDAQQARDRDLVELGRLIRAWESLAAADAEPADLARGRAVFRDACARCHGRDTLGPPARALPRSAVLPAAIAEPAAYGGPAGWTFEIARLDGLLVTGRVVEERAGVVTVEDSLGARTSVRRDALERFGPWPASLMPAGLTAGMSDADVHALLGWLVSRPD